MWSRQSCSHSMIVSRWNRQFDWLLNAFKSHRLQIALATNKQRKFILFETSTQEITLYVALICEYLQSIEIFQAKSNNNVIASHDWSWQLLLTMGITSFIVCFNGCSDMEVDDLLILITSLLTQLQINWKPWTWQYSVWIRTQSWLLLQSLS